MRKLFALLLACVMVLSLVACGTPAEPTTAPTTAPTAAPTQAPTEPPVVYSDIASCTPMTYIPTLTRL